MPTATTKKVLVPVGDWVEDYEAMIPIDSLEMLGFEVDVVSPGKKAGQMVLSCIHDFDRSNIDGATDTTFENALGTDLNSQPMAFQLPSERRGHAIRITKTFEEVKVEEYTGIFCVGGRAPEYLQLNDDIIGWVKRHFAAGKPIGSICHGIQMLATAEVVRGKVCTGHPGCRPQAQLAGAKWDPTNHLKTVVDGNLITASEWTALPGLMAKFAQAMGASWSISDRVSPSNPRKRVAV